MSEAYVRGNSSYHNTTGKSERGREGGGRKKLHHHSVINKLVIKSHCKFVV